LNDRESPVNRATLAEDLVAVLAAQRVRVVFAESCTAGLVAAWLAAVPGVSEWLCGSAVTYQSATKTAWLGVPEALIASETAVSASVATAMARGVLEKTPQAELAASITGHLGPHAPAGFDGLTFIGLARRQAGEIVCETTRYQLQETGRLPRQQEAAARVLQRTLTHLQGAP
jgi:PncC family amidohydrolase